MKKRRVYLVVTLLGLMLVGGCGNEAFQLAPSMERQNNRLDGIDYKQDIQGEDATFLG